MQSVEGKHGIRMIMDIAQEIRQQISSRCGLNMVLSQSSKKLVLLGSLITVTFVSTDIIPALIHARLLMVRID